MNNDHTENYIPIPSEAMYTDVPLCGSELMYDNGFSVNGYKWKTASEFQSGSATVHTPNCGLFDSIMKFQLINDSIKIYTSKKPIVFDTWEIGDEFLNIGTDSSWILRVVNSNDKK